RQLHSYKHRHVDLTPTHSQIDIAHLSLFSYHTTPTTELYTLSLHDALPVFSGLTGRREADDFAWFESYVPAYEARNGQMWRKSNECAAQLAARLDKIAVAGSDAHALSGVGLTYTEVPGARTVNEFFAGLRAGSGRVAGEHGSYGRLTADVLSIIGSFFSDMPWTAVLSPLALLVPVFSAGHWMNEVRFCRKWRAVMEDRGKRQRKLWDIDPGFEANWAS